MRRFGLVARSGRARRALTLLEVVVSLAIFLFSLAAIAQLVRFSTEQAVEGQLKTQARLLAESKLAEVVAGATALSAQGETAFEHDSNYLWSMECEEDSELTGLYHVTVHVSRERANGPKVEIALSQMIFDPSLRGSTQPSTTAANGTGGGP